MRSGPVWLLGLTGAAVANALSLEKRDNPAVVALPLVRERDSSSQISKRSKTVAVESITEYTSAGPVGSSYRHLSDYGLG